MLPPPLPTRFIFRLFYLFFSFLCEVFYTAERSRLRISQTPSLEGSTDFRTSEGNNCFVFHRQRRKTGQQASRHTHKHWERKDQLIRCRRGGRKDKNSSLAPVPIQRERNRSFLVFWNSQQQEASFFEVEGICTRVVEERKYVILWPHAVQLLINAV